MVEAAKKTCDGSPTPQNSSIVLHRELPGQPSYTTSINVEARRDEIAKLNPARTLQASPLPFCVDHCHLLLSNLGRPLKLSHREVGQLVRYHRRQRRLKARTQMGRHCIFEASSGIAPLELSVISRVTQATQLRPQVINFKSRGSTARSPRGGCQSQTKTFFVNFAYKMLADTLWCCTTAAVSFPGCQYLGRSESCF